MDTEVLILIGMKLATDRQTDIHEQTVWLVIDKLRSICEMKEKETYTNSTPTYMIGTLKSSRQFMGTKDRMMFRCDDGAAPQARNFAF